MPQSSFTAASPEQQIAALRTGVGVAPLRSGWIAVTGADRVRWLNGMVTNSVQALTPGEGAYTFLLNAQGRIQGDAVIFALPDLLILQTSPSQTEGMLAALDRFIIMDEVELADVSGEWHGLVIAGPRAAEMLTAAGIPARPSRLLRQAVVPWQGADVSLINAYSPLLPRFEVWSRDADKLGGLASSLLQAGATACDEAGVELLRILEGTPLYGTDLRDRDLPQETGQTRALHFNKGCYLGQEIVERIRSRGNVHRTFTQFALTGTVPAPGAALTGEDSKPVGELTSIASIPIDGRRLALGFVRREALDRGLPLTYDGGAATAANAPHLPTSAS